MREALNLVLEGKSLSRKQAEQVMSEMTDPSQMAAGQVTSEQISAFLIALRMKRESVDELLGFLDCLQKKAIKVGGPGTPQLPSELPSQLPSQLIDVCGTGGDGAHTFNISTTVAFVVAAAGQPVAKHGNRSVSSRSGSFDVLEALGLRFEADPQVVANSIREFGLGLLFAPAFHPALKVLAPIRKNLGVYTVFNALGVLLNPAHVKRQLIGVYSPLLLEKFAEVLKNRGSQEAMIVRGEDGLDELSLCAPTQIVHLENGQIREYCIHPEDFGLKRVASQELKGGDAQENARILVEILRGQKGPKRDVVLLNAAAALVVGGKALDFQEGIERAVDAIDSGRADQLLQKMRAQS